MTERIWVPTGLARRKNIASLAYVVIDELESNMVGLTVAPWPTLDTRGRLHFDFARPEWFTVDENTLYRVVNGSGAEAVWLGSELKDGIPVAAPAQLLVEAKSR